MTDFHKMALPTLLVGPFSESRVIVDGRVIPRLTGIKDGDKVSLMVDRRFAASFSEDDARSAAWLIAQALAIGAGYPHLGAENKDQPFAPIGCEVSIAPDGGVEFE